MLPWSDEEHTVAVSVLSRQSNPSNFNYGARVEERRQAFRQLGRFEPPVCDTRLLPERRRPKLDLAKQRYREVSQPLKTPSLRIL